MKNRIIILAILFIFHITQIVVFAQSNKYTPLINELDTLDNKLNLYTGDLYNFEVTFINDNNNNDYYIVKDVQEILAITQERVDAMHANMYFAQEIKYPSDQSEVKSFLNSRAALYIKTTELFYERMNYALAKLSKPSVAYKVQMILDDMRTYISILKKLDNIK
jgi:hypothetical protein